MPVNVILDTLCI